MQKIIHLVPVYPPYKGGMGRVVHELVKSLRRMNAYRIDIGTPQYKGRESSKEEHVYSIPSLYSIGNAAVIPKVIPLLKNYDVCHMHIPFFGCAEFVLLWTFLYRKKKLIVTYHMDATAEGLKGFIFKIYDALILPFLFQKAEKILVSSTSYAEHSRNTVLFDKWKEKVSVCPLGVSEVFFSTPKVPSPAGEKLPIVLFVGGLDKAHAFKGVDILLDSFAKLTVPYQGVIVGDGELRSMYETKAKKMGLPILWKGAISDEELREEYVKARVTVLPSVSAAEAYGLVLLESYACGTPVIASDLPGVRELVDHGTTGFLVPPNTVEELTGAIERVLDLPKDTFRDAIECKIKEYDWDSIAVQVNGVYEEVLSKKGTK